MSEEVQHLREEIWNIMQAVAEMGVTDERQHFYFECGGDDEDEAKSPETTQAADQLVKMGDSLTNEYAKTKEFNDLVEEITQYILSKSENYNDKLNAELGLQPSLTFSLVGTTALKIFYGNFKEKLGKFLFRTPDNELGQIALVMSITKGVFTGLRETSPNGVALAKILGANYIVDNYEQYLKVQGGLIRGELCSNSGKEKYVPKSGGCC